MQRQLEPEEALRLTPVLPVIAIEDAADAIPLAKALLAGGVVSVEITLRTPAALNAIRAICDSVPEMIVGAGTVLNLDALAAAAAAGARYALSPGATPNLLETARGAPIPLIPGIATASELMLGLDLGYRHFKFFPAEQLGGIAALSAFAGPLPLARFCPTGGINADKAAGYLALENVLCVGGSWVAPSTLIKAGDWAAIEANARRASQLR